MQILLSIIAISHNQCSELRRCLDSILAMRLPFSYEIIVSDDRSTDGTREMLEKEYADKVIITYCNSDEGHCANNSQRSGYNRCNAYPLAKGKYIAHVDADDYFCPGADVYARQVAALEQHPECALAMSNCLVQNGEHLSEAKPWPFPKQMTDGEILDAEEFLSKDYFRINQCFMQRRNLDVDPISLYGNRYVDSVITYHHLQFGKIVYVDACDYVYVRNEQSVTLQLAKQQQDREIIWCLGLYIPLLIPRWFYYFIKTDAVSEIKHVLDLALSDYKLEPQNYDSLRNLNAWIYECFSRDLSVCDKIRLKIVKLLLRLTVKFGKENGLLIKILRTVLYGYKTNKYEAR